MLIEIAVDRFYDWELLQDKPAKGAVSRRSATGEHLVRIERKVASVTSVNVPESEIANLTESFEGRGVAKDRAAVVAWYLEEVVMPNHAPPDAWTALRVRDTDDEVEKALLRRFGVKKLADPTAPAPEQTTAEDAPRKGRR